MKLPQCHCQKLRKATEHLFPDVPGNVGCSLLNKILNDFFATERYLTCDCFPVKCFFVPKESFVTKSFLIVK